MTRKGGVVTTITIRVATTVRNVKMKERRERGMTSSMMYVSLENLLRIRPRGVVSKKNMGDRRMFLSMELWRVREAKMAARAREKAAKRIMNDWITPNAPYTPR